jgi:hypothetical protein
VGAWSVGNLKKAQPSWYVPHPWSIVTTDQNRVAPSTTLSPPSAQPLFSHNPKTLPCCQDTPPHMCNLKDNYCKKIFNFIFLIPRVIVFCQENVINFLKIDSKKKQQKEKSLKISINISLVQPNCNPGNATVEYIFEFRFAAATFLPTLNYVHLEH